MRAEEQKREKYLPTLLVQQIRLQWYKDCRGGNAAAQRNQYPRAMRLPKDFFSYYPFGLPTHFASIIQRPDGFQIDRDCRRLMEWKPNGTMRLHPFELIQQEHGIHVRYDCFYTPPELQAQKQEIDECHQALSEVLGKTERRLVLQIIDAKDRIAEDTSIDSFTAGFELAWKLSAELNHYENEQSVSCRTAMGLGARFASKEAEK